MKNLRILVLNTGLILGLTTWYACSTKSSDKESESLGGGAGTEDVSSLKDLGLSGVLKISLPDSVKGSGNAAGLRLNDGKSFEACELRESVREGLSSIAEVSTTLCMLEDEDSIVFGEKLSISFDFDYDDLPDLDFPEDGAPPPNGPPSAPLTGDLGLPDTVQIWIDNSEQSEGKLTVYLCMDEVLEQMIEIEGASQGKAKGRMILKSNMSFGGMDFEYHRTMDFDNKLTDPDRTTISLKELISITSDAFDTEKLRRMIAMDLSDTGVSKVISSNNGAMFGTDMAFASVGFFDLDFGSVMATGKVSFGANEDPFEFSNASYFDGASNIVDPSDFPAAFGNSGSVKVESSMVPGYLPENFQPDGFPAGAWDCSGTREIDFNIASQGSGGSCEAEWDELTESDCYSDAFTQGEEVVIELDDDWEWESFDEFGLKNKQAQLIKYQGLPLV